MFDGFSTYRAAVDEGFLIHRLDLFSPFSTSYGDIQHDQPLVSKTYKGLHVHGKPRSKLAGVPNGHWFHLRGSLIKAANNGLHNQDAKGPYSLLAVLDDLAIQLGINVFKTPLNGLELSTTVWANHPQQLRDNFLSYLNHRPNFSSITDRGGVRLPYAEVEAGQHKFKLYSPVEGFIRAEVKVNRMQYLGSIRPEYLADLAQPAYAAPMASKLLAAFDKIMWSYPAQLLDELPPYERDLYMKGQVFSYWQVLPKNFAARKDFKREEKQREREKVLFNKLVTSQWTIEPPAQIRQRIQDQLDQYIDMIHSSTYRATLDIYQERWHFVGNLPSALKLPKRLTVPLMSEIYPLSSGRFPTTTLAENIARLQHPKRWLSANDLRSQPKLTVELLAGLKPRRSYSKRPPQTDEERAWKRQRNRASNEANNLLRRIRKMLNPPGGLSYFLTDIQPMLSGRMRIALAHGNQSLADLTNQSKEQAKPLPLFPGY